MTKIKTATITVNDCITCTFSSQFDEKNICLAVFLLNVQRQADLSIIEPLWIGIHEQCPLKEFDIRFELKSR